MKNMKKVVLLFLLFLSGFLFGQDLTVIQKKLNLLQEKRLFWSEDQSETSYDSLDKYNRKFQNLIIDFSSKNPKTLAYPFDTDKAGFNIVSSKDGNFRIYTWNEFGGGTMQFYQNVFQFESAGKVFSKLNIKDNQDNGCRYFEINEVESAGKKYYITSSIIIGSSANFYYQIKVFSIENGELNENAKLIKTKTGIRNTLGYEVDLSSSSNRDRTDGIESSDYMQPIYDKKTNTIIIPLITSDGKITKNKIKYQFNGAYFEKN